MKTYRIFGREINFHFSIDKVKRVEFSLPDWADDAHLRQGSNGDWGTSDGKTKVIYFKGSKKFELPVPDCKRSVQVSLTPLYSKDWDGCTRKHSTNRKLVVDLYF